MRGEQEESDTAQGGGGESSRPHESTGVYISGEEWQLIKGSQQPASTPKLARIQSWYGVTSTKRKHGTSYTREPYSC